MTLLQQAVPSRVVVGGRQPRGIGSVLKPLRTSCRPAKAARGRQALPQASLQPAVAAGTAAPPPPSYVASANDERMEASRVEMRAVFDADRWIMHRSTDRYFRHLWGLPSSRVLQGLFKPIGYILAISAAVCAYGTAQAAGALPATLPLLASAIKLKELFGMTSFALSLLLVFRTNASYARWDEGRKMWGMVLNRTRNICRLGLAWIGDDKRELRSMLCRWAPAFSKTLMCHLRKGEDLREELEGILLPHEIEGVLRASHRPNYVLQVLAQIVRTAGLPTAATLRMEDDLTNFGDSLGGCERLLRTPIPLFYTRHTSRFLMIWLTFLPATLWPACGLLTLPLVFLISFLLLGVDKIGVSIEEPFSILALEVIAGTALANVRELVAMHEDTAAGVAAAANGNGGAAGAPAEADVSAAHMVTLAGAAA
ncbi:UPF0187 chloroplastic [Micractinium conductrix]|uniref:UPF0187 chloroplastic n=1 Tax=Micractinium conductrix TaxID=554055 RepID=A0A2P6VNA3_9CHLO|nr:UPF0187 chloroplastic [Micractinium conductrix]|eukprot:PSC75582.1 UPF0187 chloroplastic [Micractinium conductrix]